MNELTESGMFSKLLDPATSKPAQAPASTAPVVSAGPMLIPFPAAPLPTTEPAIPKRKQVSAYLSPVQFQILKHLYFQLNAGEAKIEKSELIGLALEVLAWWLHPQVRKYTSIQQLREDLRTQMAPYLGSQVPDHLAT